MKTNPQFLKAYNTTIAWFLAILGFSAVLGTSCAKYGCPVEEFTLEGTVFSKETNLPKENIRVSIYSVITFTDNQGNYQISDWGRCGKGNDHTFFVEFRDTTDKYRDLDAVIEFRGGEKRKKFNVGMTPNTQQNHENEN